MFAIIRAIPITTARTTTATANAEKVYGRQLMLRNLSCISDLTFATPATPAIAQKRRG